VRYVRFYRSEGPLGGQLTMRRDRGFITSASMTGSFRLVSTAPSHASSTSTSSWNADRFPDSTAARDRAEYGSSTHRIRRGRNPWDRCGKPLPARTDRNRLSFASRRGTLSCPHQRVYPHQAP